MTTRIKQWIFIIVLPPCHRLSCLLCSLCVLQGPCCSACPGPCLCVPAVNPSSLKVEDGAHSKRKRPPLHSTPTLFRISQFSAWVTPSTCRHLDISDMTAHALRQQDVSPSQVNALRFYCSFTADCYYCRMEFVWVVPWVSPKQTEMRKTNNLDFSLNFGCVITQFWWAAVAQRSLRVGCLNLSSFLLPPCFAISVALSPHANIIMDPLTRTIANLFSMAAGVVMTILFARKLYLFFMWKVFFFPHTRAQEQTDRVLHDAQRWKKNMRAFQHILQACTCMTFYFYPSLRQQIRWPPV